MKTNIKKNLITMLLAFLCIGVFFACNHETPEISYSLTIPYNITVTRDGTALTSQDKVYEGDELKIAYTLDSGYELDYLKVNGSDFANQSTFTVAANNVVIEYRQKKIGYTITIPDNVTVIRNDVTLTAEDKVNIGDELTITAATPPGFELQYLLVNGNHISNDTFIVGADNVNIELSQTPIEYSIKIPAKVNVTRNGYLISSNTKVYINDNLRITYTLDTGYELDYIKVNGVDLVENTYVVETTNVTITYNQKKINYTISVAVANGEVLANKETATYNETVTVTVTPDNGYKLKAGSLKYNGTKINENTLTFIMPAENVEITAEFIEITKKLNYNYNTAGEKHEIRNIELRYLSLEDTVFEIPEKEHFNFEGWYLDKDFTMPAADNTGNILIDREIFGSNIDTIYAKWSVIEEIRYKILMVFVTEVHATLETREGQLVAVDYVMSDIERQICELAVELFTETVNEAMEGLVIFEVDSYFTTDPVYSESFSYGTTSNYKWTYSATADNIPETKEMCSNYRSVITTFNMNDYGSLLHFAAGLASKKHASISMENLFLSPILNQQPYEVMLDRTNLQWNSLMHIYLHEFTHTVETWFPYGEIYEYHAAESYNWSVGIYKGVYGTSLYLLNRMEIDGERVGIPYFIWKEKSKTYTYVYNGATNNNTEEQVTLTSTTLFETQLLVPIKDGYVFEGWYLEDNFQTRITSYKGIILSVLGYHVIYYEELYLYAKWLPA